MVVVTILQHEGNMLKLQQYMCMQFGVTVSDCMPKRSAIKQDTYTHEDIKLCKAEVDSEVLFA